jgi:hypothetical protein
MGFPLWSLESLSRSPSWNWPHQSGASAGFVLRVSRCHKGRVAADLIPIVAVALTLTTAWVLAIIMLIRTCLSFTLELELTGRWP